jgi:hypothetical protein
MATSMPTIGQLQQNAAAANGIPVAWLTMIQNVENPNLNPNAMSYTGVQGLAQITKATWATANGPNVPYSLDPAAQINTQALLLAKYQSDYNGDFALAAAAYNGGPGVANQAQKLIAQGVPESQAISMAAGNIYGQGSGKQTEVNNYVAKATGQSAASVAAQSNQATSPAGGNAQIQTVGVDDSDPAVAVPVMGMTISQEQITSINTAINPPLVTDMPGLMRVPWYADSGILQVDAPTTAVGFPVTFQIYFSLAQGPVVLLALNASIRTFQKAMRHITNRQRTRTGFQVNLWGSQPDQITGTASTGLFMNQLGVTDFLSLSAATTEVQNAVIQAFSSPSTSPNQLNTVASSGTNDGFFRVAAKDAFVEFLSMFKNNGTVWFANQNSTGYTTGTAQMAADVWSPLTGSTTFQNAARRMDVMTRGSVVMTFRNTAYYGYFKNLSWTMDAEHPFRWIFNFVFQVESTIATVTVPTLGTGVSNSQTKLNRMATMGLQPQTSVPQP